MNIPLAIIQNLKDLQIVIESSTAVSGGDINEAVKIITTAGNTFFLKYNTTANAQAMLSSECQDLALLKANGVRVPDVIAQAHSSSWAYILMKWIEPRSPNPAMFASDLMNLHEQTQTTFGLPYDNHIGTLAQSNTQYQDFADFYLSTRIEPQVRLARDTCSIIFSYSLKHFHRIIESEIPSEPPALIHGDLWNGNMIYGAEGPVFVDPSVSYNHREMDLAMMRLFGNFGNEVYLRYEEELPLEKGWQKRADLFQLYYLLVHLNIFGAQYQRSVDSIFRKYLL